MALLFRLKPSYSNTAVPKLDKAFVNELFSSRYGLPFGSNLQVDVKLNVAVCVKYVGPMLRHVRSTQGDAYGGNGATEKTMQRIRAAFRVIRT